MADGAAPWRRRLADVIGSVLTALLVFAAVPAVLVVIVGDPLSGGLGHQWDHAARVAVTVLAGVAWVAWLACCLQLTRAVVHHVRRGHVGLAAGAPLTDRVAARIAVGILAFSTLGVPIVVASSAGAASPVVTQRVSPAPSSVLHAVEPPPAAAPTASVYVVEAGDSLWTIAERELGDGADWTEIAALNLGKTMADGRRFVDPSLIYAGWTLTMPAGGAPGATAATVVADPAPPPTPAVPVPSVTTTPVTAPMTAPSSSPAPSPLPSQSASSHTEPAAHTDHTAHRPSSLPELALLGVGAVGCAALARRSRQRRLWQHQHEAWDDTPWPSDEAVDADVLLQRFSDIPALELLERANCCLRAALADEWPEPIVTAICVGADGVEFWVQGPSPPPPDGFEEIDGGSGWLVPHSALDSHEVETPHFPVLIPIGDDARGAWSIPLGPGMCLPVLGPSAAEFMRSARHLQQSWSWADLVTVTDDPTVAAREAQRYRSDASTRQVEAPVLFFGDPADLPEGTLPLISVITARTTANSEISLLVDAHGASIHPLARTVQPNLIGPALSEQLDELLRPVPPPVDRSDVDDSLRRVVLTPSDALPEVPPLLPGLVEVKLLTMTPRLDGLREELPPNRERRAVELVAYLALHRPDMVTSDRLRTRVLASGEVDAAAKTLFNTATAARRAMGADDEGQPLLPPGTRTGHYRISDAVTVDVQRAAELAAIGSTIEDEDRAIAHLRAALSLIEGEPLANALSGYHWWSSEGHGARIAAVMVHAACDLAALCVAGGHFDLAQWGLDQARLLEPYSEALSRTAMQVAAAAGDADRLRREWLECQRRVDELDPGSSPSPRTERLYGELAQQVLA